MADPKPIEFRGSSLDDLRAFPFLARPILIWLPGVTVIC